MMDPCSHNHFVISCNFTSSCISSLLLATKLKLLYIQSEEDGASFPGRARTVGSGQSQTISTVSSDSSLHTRLLNNGNSPNHPAAAGAEQQVINGRQSEVDSATADTGGHAHHQGLVVSEEEIQKLVAMGFERTQVEVAVAAADGDFDLALEILMTQLG